MNGAVNVPAPILVTHGKQRNALGRCASGVSWRTPVLFSMGGCLQIAVKRRFESVLIRLSRCPLLLDCPASVPRGESSDKGQSQGPKYPECAASRRGDKSDGQSKEKSIKFWRMRCSYIGPETLYEFDLREPLKKLCVEKVHGGIKRIR